MEENGKAVNLEIDEEEEALEDILVEEEKDEDMEEETEGMDPLTRFLAYVPLQKWKVKVPKDLDDSKSSLQILLLPDDIIFEGAHLGWLPSLKFEDWDLVGHNKFPHLVTAKLMKPKKHTVMEVIELELRKWLHGVKMAGLLNLFWVPHYHHTLVTIFIIRKLL